MGGSSDPSTLNINDTIPVPVTNWPSPKLHIQLHDLSHPGAELFFANVNPTRIFREAVLASYEWLYTSATVPRKLKSITLILRSMDGVAYTTGGSEPNTSEIHFSLDHIVNSSDRAADEIKGVLIHEVVHCFQYNGNDTAPSGMIEGIADYVRLREGYCPPHWSPSGGDDWDAGYQTTAYFLNWLEQRYGDGTVRDLNECMKDRDYSDKIFKECCGRKVGKLWHMYCSELEGKQGVKNENDGDV